MKILSLLIGGWLAAAATPQTLDPVRELAARLTAHLPAGGAPMVCTACDGEWTAGGEPVRRIERALTSALGDPRAAGIATADQLGTLLSEHFGKMLIETAGDKPPTTTGKDTLCGLSRPPCALFNPKLFEEFCAPPEGL
jgi:hypothetical protein